MSRRRVGSAGAQPRRGLIERRLDPVPDFLDLGLGRDQGRAERDHIARHGAHDQPILLAYGRDERASALRRGEGDFCRFVADEFDRADEADAARLTYEGMGGETLEPRLKDRRRALDLAQDVALLVKL